MFFFGGSLLSTGLRISGTALQSGKTTSLGAIVFNVSMMHCMCTTLSMEVMKPVT